MSSEVERSSEGYYQPLRPPASVPAPPLPDDEDEVAQREYWGDHLPGPDGDVPPDPTVAVPGPSRSGSAGVSPESTGGWDEHGEWRPADPSWSPVQGWEPSSEEARLIGSTGLPGPVGCRSRHGAAQSDAADGGSPALPGAPAIRESDVAGASSVTGLVEPTGGGEVASTGSIGSFAPDTSFESDESPAETTDPNGTAGPSSPVQATPAPGSFGGRHARRGSAPSTFPVSPTTPSLQYIPRHAVRPNDAEQVSPTELTEVLARVREDPTERPMADRPESRRTSAPTEEPEPEEQPGDAEGKTEAQPLPPGKRVRVVLSQRKGSQARPVRTVVDVQELTQVGDLLSTSLIKSQLALALRVAAIAVLGLGALPAMFFYVPGLSGFVLFGIRLPWLLLGVAVYPFMLLLGWLYSRSADNLERIFADHIQS